MDRNNERDGAGLRDLWNEFHSLVNMPSPVLRDWLLTTPDGADTYLADPDLDAHALGERVLEILSKRRGDLTAADAEVMAQTIDQIRELLDNRPTSRSDQEPWRDSLRTLGHDPDRASAAAGSEL